MKKILFFILLSSFIANIIAQEKNRTVILNNTKIDVLLPVGKINGCILVLPGWNFPQDDICIKSNFCDTALMLGYALIMPDMQKSVYQSAFYPETRADRKVFHTIQWLTDTLFPFIQKDFKLLLKEQNNYLFGISTGGRGVALLAEKTGNFFKAGAALSGDYDQTLMNNDKLMISFYGNYTDFPDRWKNIDNPLNNSKLLKIPLFLAHGENDKIVPVQQTLVFYENIRFKSSLIHKMNIIPDAGHDYHFWESQYSNVFDFFEKNK